MRGRYAAGVALLAGLTLAVAGCGGDGPRADGFGDGATQGGAATDTPAWPAAGTPLAAAGLVWWADDELHLPDGSTVPLGETDRDPGDLVVAGDRVWVRGWTQPPEETSFERRDALGDADALLLVDASGAVEDTGVGIDSLAASPDGRYVAMIDLTSGEPDRYGTPQAALVVVDTRTGLEVVRSTEGMGDLAEDDLAALYPDVELEVHGFADGRFWVDTAEGTRTVDPVDGRIAADPEDEPDRAPWREVVAPAPTEVAPGRWLPLQRWADGTVVAVVGEPTGGSEAGVLATCAPAASRCASVPESAGRVVRLPAGSAWDTVVDLGEPRWEDPAS